MQQRSNIGDIMFGAQQSNAQQGTPNMQYTPRMGQVPQYIPFTPGAQIDPFGQSGWNGQNQHPSLGSDGYQTGQSSFASPSGTPQHSGNGGTPSTDAYFMDQQSPYTATSFSSQQASAGEWSQQFLGQQGNGPDAMLWENNAGNADMGNMDAMLGMEDPLAELERM
jgi:hypothetical protein